VYTQTNRRIAISTPLGEDVLLLRAFHGVEYISQPFSFTLDLLSESPSINFQDIVGKNVTLRIFDTDGGTRYWNGFIWHFSQGTRNGRLTGYTARMAPWLWFLTRQSDCRIFQNKTVPEILQKIFVDLGFHDFELHLYGSFQPREYCVQYRETDFNFVSRLMEDEGIYYYFHHENGKHTLILANDAAAHQPCPNQATARYDSVGGGLVYEDVVTGWSYNEEFRSGGWTHTDYNFETPSTSLAVSVNGRNKYEFYDYPGEHRVRGDGDRRARLRLEEEVVPAVVHEGDSGCRYFTTGFKFTLQDHYRPDLNQPYLLTEVTHIVTSGGAYEVGDSGAETTYRNRFKCIPASTMYRAPRSTPEPFVQGCQTAVVVGPPGEEIYTDEHGRVKVQFHWDREGKKNENSSCWIRVSQPWAGAGWGAVSIPRIGQEVIVDFLEGDPDRPMIVGRVYNAERKHPFPLPAGAAISGVKSNSTKGGGGHNEISLDDTKGKELINIHGQYDMTTTVLHNDTQTVKADRVIQVDGVHHETIKKEIVIKSTGDQIYVEASNQITLKVGNSLLYMDAGGNITLKGKNISIVGSDIVDLNFPGA
jgi:type VI secretion system secreted protein VgrG